MNSTPILTLLLPVSCNVLIATFTALTQLYAEEGTITYMETSEPHQPQNQIQFLLHTEEGGQK